MEVVFMIVYIAASYWAMNKVWWSKRAYVYTNATQFYITRFLICMIVGLVAIPVAIIQSLIGKNQNKMMESGEYPFT